MGTEWSPPWVHAKRSTPVSSFNKSKPPLKWLYFSPKNHPDTCHGVGRRPNFLCTTHCSLPGHQRSLSGALPNGWRGRGGVGGGGAVCLFKPPACSDQESCVELPVPNYMPVAVMMREHQISATNVLGLFFNALKICVPRTLSLSLPLPLVLLPRVHCPCHRHCHKTVFCTEAGLGKATDNQGLRCRHSTPCCMADHYEHRCRRPYWDCSVPSQSTWTW